VPSRLVTRDLLAYPRAIVSCLTTFAATRESLLGVDAPAGRDLGFLGAETDLAALHESAVGATLLRRAEHHRRDRAAEGRSAQHAVGG
jgi:hypothetical protein